MQIRPLRPCRRSVNRDAARWYRADGDANAPDGSSLFAGVAQQERHNVENVESAGATPAVGTTLRRFPRRKAMARCLAVARSA